MNDEIILAVNGKSDWRVVTGKQPDKLEQRAIEELAYWFEQVTGVALHKVTSDSERRPYEIVIGRTGRKCAAEHEPLPRGEVGDESVVVITPKQIYIEGASSRGTLYGVYRFLEDHLGIRWFSKTVTHVPRRTIFAVHPANLYDKPAVRVRMEPFKVARSFDFAVRNRLNYTYSDEVVENPEYGCGKYPISYGHSFDTLIPDALFEKHPEYFPLIDGRRVHGQHHQRCLTNPEVVHVATEKVREILRANPGQQMIAVGQSDTYPDQPNNCHCEACSAIDAEEGTPMGSLLRFVNAVADAIAEEFPNVMINTLAYRYTRTAPKITKPRDNVAVILCSIECCFSHALIDHCGADYNDRGIGHVNNEMFFHDMLTWAKIAKNLIIWDYVTNFPEYIAPHPNLHALAPNMRFFVENNAYGVYPEGAHDLCGAELDELRSYMLARLMWNPYTDDDLDMQEFLIGCLGVAAAPIYKYLQRLAQKVREENIHVSTYAKPDKQLFSPDIIAYADAMFDRAERLAPNDQALMRVQKMRMSIRYVKMCLYSRSFPIQERRQIAVQFIDDMARFGIEGLCEGGANIETTQKRVDVLLNL